MKLQDTVLYRMRRSLLFLALLLVSVSGYGQQRIAYPGNSGNGSGDTIGNSQRERVLGFYLRKTDTPRDFIDGKGYHPYYLRSRTTPVLRAGEDRTASLTIHGRTYDNIVLHYDTFTGEVIYTDDSLIYDSKVRFVALNSNNISRFDLYFRLDTMSFRYFGKDPETTFNLQEGFYEVVRDLSTRFIIRHVSTSYISYSKTEEYTYAPVSYIRIGNGFSMITSRKQFISLFGDRSEEISHFLRQKKIRIPKADKRQINDVLKYYESL
ncbi:MAG: hypothetical protein WAV93_02785 [Bacteroidales bacterium]